MPVGQFEVCQSQLKFLLAAMEICAEDEKLCMEGVHLQSPLHLQPALLRFVLNEVVFGLAVQLLQLGRDHLQKGKHFGV